MKGLRLKRWSRGDAPSMRDPMSLPVALVYLTVSPLAYVLLVRWLIAHMDLRAALISALSAGVLFVPTFVIGLVNAVPAFMRWTKERHWDTWQGRYYAFDNRQVRVDASGTDIWIVLRDVTIVAGARVSDLELEALPAWQRRIHPEFRALALTHGAVIELLKRRANPDALRVRNWLEHEVIPPIERRRELDRRRGAD